MNLKTGKTVATVSFDLAEVQAINPKLEDKPAVKMNGRLNVTYLQKVESKRFEILNVLIIIWTY
jgi:hypothetical protein